MSATDRYILLFVISTLLVVCGCEKAGVADDDGPAPSDVTLVVADTVVRHSGERYGSAASPYTVGDLAVGSLGLYVRSTGVELDGKWVVGYVVGYVQGTNFSNVVFDAGGVESNIVLADDPDEDDPERTVPVQLATASSYVEVRQALNLCYNPWVLGRRVAVKGRICSYMSTIGMKNTIDYIYED